MLCRVGFANLAVSASKSSLCLCGPNQPSVFFDSMPETNSPQRAGLFDLHNVEASALGKMIRRELLLALVPFVLLAGGSFIAIHHLPTGKAFVLESRGVGIFYDFMSALMLFIFFGFIYMAPSLWVRPSLSIVYRFTFFLVFTVGLFWIEGAKIVAVVQTDDSFIFIRRFPYQPIPVRGNDIWSISTCNTGAIAALSVQAMSGRGRADDLVCQRVWLKDQRTMQIMDELAAELHAAQAKSLKPVAPATPAR